ncbi:MAG: PEP/pyruvate-binding domain-containing protein [Muribaculaceae bacterium]|nr:PEP/pyruvate-binding domain-containing protein [Muribaculaceae bacterium]
MNEEALSQMYLKDTAFQNLMQRRVFNVLLVASPYDAFMMEEDGRVEEQLYFEYVKLNLSSPPRVARVSNAAEAVEAMRVKVFDLVVVMPANDISESLAGARAIKAEHEDVPMVVLTPFSKEVSRRLQREDLSGIDYVFSWLGNMDLLLAIIKLLEDKMNAEVDINEIGVRMILLVEDSVRFYSSILPRLYKFLLKQSQHFSTEALNEHEQMLRMRGRPKVMLARDYDEAMALYERFGDKMLGLISDVSFPRAGAKLSDAGLQLAREIRRSDPYLPIIIESSESENASLVKDFAGVFIDKNSKKLSVDLGHAIMNNFGFGDFIIRDPGTEMEIMRICNLKDMQRLIFEIPADALYWHARRNDISRWLYSRALFPIADVVRHHRFESIEEAPAVRQLFFDLIVKYRRMKNRGVVAVFRKDRFDRYSNFARIGDGSLGGKGRGLAFVDSIIKHNTQFDDIDGVCVSIPRTVVLCTDVFDRFMSDNNLYPLALSTASDEEILRGFIAARLPDEVREDLEALLDVVACPLAVRSSSLLEDSHYQPFAGVYSTYMIPYGASDEERLAMLVSAIKGVYASVFFRASKTYMAATSNVIDEEKMAVIIQEVVGEEYGGYYMPPFSGVGRSLNYYPLGDERPEDGVAHVAVGLGKYIVDGGNGLRFSPRFPERVLQTSTLDLALRDTQTHLLALRDKAIAAEDFTADDGFNIVSLPVQQFAGTGALRYAASTYDAADGVLRDCECGRGRRVITFSNMLRDRAFPLARVVDVMLTKGQEAMQRPVEIEFAGTLRPASDGRGRRGQMYWLQIRPIIDRKELVDESATEAPDEALLLRSSSALGNGTVDDVHAVVYVRPDTFDSANNAQLVRVLRELNDGFTARGEHYVLIGPGRWGSTDPALGIPVAWTDIASARLIVEAALCGYKIEPSQGTHFFQNLTSLGVGYFAIDSSAGSSDFYDIDALDRQPAVFDDGAIRVVRFENPAVICINGRAGRGVVYKPGYFKS